MRRVIVNSTPLIILCKIGKLDILKELYREVIIPQAVLAEVTAKEDSVCRQVAGKEWIHVECVEDQSEKKMYRAKLHDGEVEVIFWHRKEKELIWSSLMIMQQRKRPNIWD